MKLNEFKKGKDPRKAMELGYGRKPETIGWKILEFIGDQGEEGVGLKDIQYHIWTELQGKDPDDFWKTSEDLDREWYKKQGRDYNPSQWGSSYNKQRGTRGHYNDALYGGSNFPGLLHKYCEKVPGTRKWRLVRMPRPGESIYSWTNESLKLVPESLNEMMDIYKKNTKL